MLTSKRTFKTWIVFFAAVGCGKETAPSTPSGEAPADAGPDTGTIDQSGGEGTESNSSHGVPGSTDPQTTSGTYPANLSSDSGLSNSNGSNVDTINSETSPSTSAETNTTNEDASATSGSDGNCEFTIVSNEVSAQMPTVGVVEWSLSGEAPTSAKIVFALTGVDSKLLNTGGEAPVSLTKTNYRTLLLGLKQSSSYTFYIEAERNGETCQSETFTLPTTGTLNGSPTDILTTVDQPEARELGFTLTSGGYEGYGAYIIDADGAVVWYATGPSDPGRIHMDYEGENMWMMSLNPIAANQGKLQYLSMDGRTGVDAITGLEFAHHDFAVMPSGKVATMVWRVDGEPIDPESDLVIVSPDGTLETAFRIGSNLYPAERYHCNALHYIPEDDSFTISDRNPSSIIKVSSTGVVQWQLSQSCSNTIVGAAKCSEQPWNGTHGHHLTSDGTFLVFNNNGDGATSHVLEYQINATSDALTATLVKDYVGEYLSPILGDVQRLPNGNTLITYSSAGKLVEVAPDWTVVQTFSGKFGYAEWRPTLYGPPARL